MIQVNELREGNLLQYFIGEEGYEWEPTKITYHDLRWCSEENENFNGVHKPIPLTEEWLLKLGLHKADRVGRYGYIYRICEIDSCWCVEKDWREDSSHFFGIEYTDTVEELMDRSFNFSYELRYVHQLQNLIFALTGEELQQTP
jgi:hypothetical protein